MIEPSAVTGIWTNTFHGIFDFWFLISIVVLVLCLVLVLTGAFTMYFGSGKSRIVGSALFAFGLIAGSIYVLAASSYWPGGEAIIDAPIRVIIVETAVYIATIAIGALIGLGIFLGAIMKA